MYYWFFSNNLIKALVSYSLSVTNVSPVLYNAIDSHPSSLLEIGDNQKWNDLLFHTQVESVLFITEKQLTKLFHPQLVKEFEADSTCSIKLAGDIGKHLGNNSAVLQVWLI